MRSQDFPTHRDFHLIAPERAKSSDFLSQWYFEKHVVTQEEMFLPNVYIRK